MRASLVLVYAEVDLDEVQSLYEHLKRDGFQPWMKEEDLLPGQIATTEIPSRIRQARVVLACASSASVACGGELQKQLRLALNKMTETPPETISVIPVRLDRCELPDHVFGDLGIRFSDIQQADLFKPDSYAKLTDALRLAFLPTGSPPEPVDTSPCGDDRLAQVIGAFEVLHAASVDGAGRTNHPAMARIRDNLSDCLDDLRNCSSDIDFLTTLPGHLAGLAKDIDDHLLNHHFEAMPAAEVLKKLETLTGVEGSTGKHRIGTLDRDEPVATLREAIGDALEKLPSAGLGRDLADRADRELRYLRREVGRPSYDAAVVSERRRRLEGVKVDLLKRTTLLTEALLAEGFPNLPAGTVFRYVSEIWCPQLVMIPAGRFLMGSPEDEAERWDDEGPQHEVTITKAFALGRYAVTFEEYDHFCNVTHREKPDDKGWGRGRRPVINVSHEDATAYCAWLSETTGGRLQLPTEAMWEYACRAGTTTAYAFGDEITTEQANFAFDRLTEVEASGRKAAEVGSFPANGWGLYEMHGNVDEWCVDTWYERYEGAPSDGSAWIDDQDTNRVVRGGSWFNDAGVVRSASRDGIEPGDRIVFLGFRCAGVQEES